MAEEVDDLGFVLSDDQTDTPEPDPESWQAQYNRNLRESWMQGFNSQKSFPDMEVGHNPYLNRGEDLIVMTRALGWEDGYLSAESGGTSDDCPYPEG